MNRKINILYLIPTFGTGGTERLVLDLCRFLDRNIFNAEVCSFSSGSFEMELKRIGKKMHILTDGVNKSSRHMTILRKGLNFTKRLSKINQLLKDKNIHIVHTHHLGPLLHTFLALLGKRKNITWVHTEHIRLDVDKAYSKRLLTVTKPLLKYPDAVTGVSNAVSSYFYEIAGVPTERIVTILNGVNVREFSNSNGGYGKRKELGFSQQEQLVGIIGNLRKQKNHQNLLKAFSMICKSIPALHLVLCGDGECRKELENLAYNLGITSQVHFLGYRLDASEIMSTFDVYCLPSFYEGMPLSLMEAWAAGKPVVATDVIGIKELVRHEENGILVPSNNPEKLAEGLLRVLKDEDLRERISRNGQKFALENCSIESMVEKYEALYLRLMGQ
jgi:glycosyltransferase involved in cell wall biosynthesis